MAGRPQQHGADDPFNANPFDDDAADDGQPLTYNAGRPPPTDDDNLLKQYNISTADHHGVGRPSESYDDFVGAGARGAGAAPSAMRSNTAGVQTVSSAAAASNSSLDRPQPHFYSDGHRAYSQTSDLHNYQSHSDIDDLEDEHRDYYGSGGLDDGLDDSRGTQYKHSAPRNRNSILSLGGGLMGRAKHMLGMAPAYSEMDLPLTEAGGQGGKGSGDGADDVATAKKTSRFKFGLGRGKYDYTGKGPRIIQLNNPPANAEHKFVDNHVATTKYNFATFVPLFLFEQFSKYANLFFLFTAILQQIPNITPTNRYTTIVPLGIVLIVSAIKEAVEDSRRRQSDTALNNSKAQVLRGSTFETTRWIKVKVGDILRVESEEPFPADMVLLASSEPEGLCYIETANLDGETNLKIKQAIPETAGLVGTSDLGRLGGRIRSEQPNSSLYTYEATLTMQVGGGERELSLTPEQLLLRGATLRNTPWVHGIVVFTGHETKLMRNATGAPFKKTAVERMVNLQILMLGAILITLSVVSAVGDLIIRLTKSDELVYLAYGQFNAAAQFFMDIFTYWVLFSNLVPISLFVTIEIVKYCHAILINSDLDMYYDKTDTPANCRTSSLVEELGQIEYIFSDKTGTLTCNQMDFRQCSIAGIQYADEVPEDRKATGDDGPGIHDFQRLRTNLAQSHHTSAFIDNFLTLLATCHTVIPERKSEKPGDIRYQAASPDEGALVDGAVQLGYQFIARKPRAVTIVVGGQELEYELLAVCEFNSTRKRMSTLFRCPDGKIRCFTKGADTVILERLAAEENPHVDATVLHLEEYAAEGLRTLCLAMREVPEQEFREWYQVFNTAQNTVSGNRAEELDKAAELIEHDLLLLGATAIEDKLQDGVPETIATLQTAGIKVWVLTGDRQETAINIGMSCRLISEDMTLLVVNEESSDATRSNLTKKLEAIASSEATAAETEILALVIDGRSLTYALEKDMEKLFLDLAVKCKAVICCRVSPLQKALVVKLVKRHLKSILLAIGDGANDVSMIQAAHVGVGIAGMEGLQAARSADVAIGQFRFLRKLLLVHGAWSYQRISKVILYSFYKNIALFMTQFWYSFQNAFSGEVIAESWTLSFYNVIFTVLPPFVLGIFDQFVSARLLDRYPQLYGLSQSGVFFKMHSFWSWVANGFYHSLLIYIFTVLFFWSDMSGLDGQPSGHWIWGTTVYTVALATVLGKAALTSSIWTKYHVLAIPGSMLLWYLLLPIYATVAPLLNFSTEYHGVIRHLFPLPTFWLATLVIPFLCLSRDYAWKYAKRMYYPQSYHHVQEIQKYNVQDYRPRMEQFQKAIRKVRQVQRMRKLRGYAFSAGEESESRVLAAYDTTRARGRFGELRTSTGGGGTESMKGF